MKFSAVILTALVAVASALREPDYTKPPSGNPIARPGLEEQVPVGVEYTITWQATTPGPVSIRLLRGPSTNVVPIHTITASTPNSGTFKWTPPVSLEVDITRYGLLIVDETTGQYQWSTQFGIKNDQPQVPPTYSVTRTVIEPPVTETTPAGTPIVTLTTTICDDVTSTAAPYPTGTGTAPGTISSVFPTAPTSYRATPTPPVPSTPPPFEGAAGRNAVSFGGAVLALAAVLAF